MRIVDPRLGEARPERCLGETGPARRRDSPHIDDNLDVRFGQRREKVAHNRGFIADRRDDRPIALRHGGGQLLSASASSSSTKRSVPS